MKRTAQSSVESRIEELREELIAFREKEGRPKCHPSKKIWNAAVELCKVASVKSVAEGISVSPSSLQNRIKAVRKNEKAVTTSFMELSPAVLAMANSAPLVPMIELERRDGLKLRLLHLPSQEVVFANILSQFMGAAS